MSPVIVRRCGLGAEYIAGRRRRYYPDIDQAIIAAVKVARMRGTSVTVMP